MKLLTQFAEPKFDFGDLLVTIFISTQRIKKRGTSQMIDVIKQPRKIVSRLLQGHHDSVTHKIHIGENVYWLDGVPFGIGEGDLKKIN